LSFILCAVPSEKAGIFKGIVPSAIPDGRSGKLYATHIILALKFFSALLALVKLRLASGKTSGIAKAAEEPSVAI
jgi:hypothetical protein